MNLSTISETLDYIADNDLRYVIEITENVPRFPDDAALKAAVFGLMGESSKGPANGPAGRLAFRFALLRNCGMTADQAEPPFE
jgi:hypothetical protein